LCFRSSEHVPFFFCFFSRNLGCFDRRLLQSSSSILFRRCLGVSSISVWVRSRSAAVRKQQPPLVLESLLLPSFDRFLCSPPDFSAVSSLGRLLCSPLDYRATSPRRLLSAPVGSITSDSTVGSITPDSSFLCVRVCRFLWCDFTRSTLVLSVGLQCCEPQAAQSASVGSIAFSSHLDLLRHQSPVQLGECADFLSCSRSEDPTLADQGEPCVSCRKHLRY
jgi:hypothetical protein